jgi:hypothetical protein
MFKYTAMKAYEGMEVQLHGFLTFTLDEEEWSASRLIQCTPG